MSMDLVRFNDWSSGANNAAQENRLPEGAARELVNLDPARGGTLELRPGFEHELQVDNLRAAFAFGERIVFVDGVQVKVFDPRGGVQLLGGVPAAGVIAGAELNGKLYLSALGERYVYDGQVLKVWGEEPPVIRVSPVVGSLPAGVYKVAATVVDGEGFESGAQVTIIHLSAGSGLSVSTADPRTLRLYASPADSHTLYDQGTFASGTVLGNVVVDTLDLDTANLVPMPEVAMLATAGGMLFGARERYLFRTEPMRPHLHDRVRGFYQFPSDIKLLAPVEGGIYVATADRTYFLSGLAGDQESQRMVHEFGAVAGTFARLPDGRATWFCEYGQAVGDAIGQVQLLNQGRFLPDIATAGAAGLLNHNGLQSAVTSMRGAVRRNGIAVSDSWTLEVL